MTAPAYATPPALLEAPELAVLAVLDHTLQQAAYVLYAAHPEFVNHDQPINAADIGADLCLADIIAEQISSLQNTIDQYRQAVTTRRGSRLPEYTIDF